MDHKGIVIAKLNWSKYYQGEEPETTFSDGDNYERFNFRRTADGRFYGSIPRDAPEEDGEWLVVFIARDTHREHYAIGWYENATFEKGRRPEYEYDKNMSRSENNLEAFTYNVHAEVAFLLPPNIRRYFKAPMVHDFERATYIFARGSNDDAEPWRQEFARFAELVATGEISQSIRASA
jgi:hypothetical protein